MQETLTLDYIAELIHEYHELIRKGYLPEGSPEMRRLSRLDYILHQITLTGEQVMEIQGLDPLVLGNNDVKRSADYQELSREHEKLEGKYQGLERRYNELVRRIEELLSPQFGLKEVLDKQRKEEERERYS